MSKRKPLKPDFSYNPTSYKITPRSSTDRLFSPWSVPTNEQYFNTVTARVAGLTTEGEAYREVTLPKFNTLFRSVMNGLITKEDNFSKYKATSGLRSRVYNSVNTWAKGQYESLLECVNRTIELYEFKRDKTITNAEYLLENGKEINHLESRYYKYVNKTNELTVRRDRPYFFLGQEIYYKQHTYKDKESFKRDYYRARNNLYVVYGIADEDNGNSEIYPKFIEMVGKRFRFGIYRAEKLLHTFTLDHKDGTKLNNQLELQKYIVTKHHYTNKKGKPAQRNIYTNKVGKAPLTLVYNRVDLTNKWTITILWSKENTKTYNVGSKFIGIDFNKTSLNLGEIDLGIKDPIISTKRIGLLHTESRANRLRKLHKVLNTLVSYCKANKICLVLENLDFEGGKKGNNRLSKVLHTIPYKLIRNLIIRKCQVHGVPIRFVNPSMTSQLGCILGEVKAGRDDKSGVLIAMKASIEGLDWLESRCKRLLQSKQFTLRVERKNQMSQQVTVVNKANWLVDPPRVIDTAGFMTYSGYLCSIVRSMTKQLGDYYWSMKKKGLPLSLVRKSLPSNFFIPCLPLGTDPLTGLKPLCSTLSTID